MSTPHTHTNTGKHTHTQSHACKSDWLHGSSLPKSFVLAWNNFAAPRAALFFTACCVCKQTLLRQQQQQEEWQGGRGGGAKKCTRWQQLTNRDKMQLGSLWREWTECHKLCCWDKFEQEIWQGSYCGWGWGWRGGLVQGSLHSYSYIGLTIFAVCSCFQFSCCCFCQQLVVVAAAATWRCNTGASCCSSSIWHCRQQQQQQQQQRPRRQHAAAAAAAATANNWFVWHYFVAWFMKFAFVFVIVVVVATEKNCVNCAAHKLRDCCSFFFVFVFVYCALD